MKKIRVSWVRKTICSAIIEAESEEEAVRKVEDGVNEGEIFPNEEGDSFDDEFNATIEE